MLITAVAVLMGLSLLAGMRLLWHYRRRARPHTLWYAVGLLLTATASLPVLYLEVTGALPTWMWWLYWFSASATVGFLAAGTGYLISLRFGRIVLVVVLLLSAALLVAVVGTAGPAPTAFTATTMNKSPTVAIRWPFLLQNIMGALIIFGGATWSFLKTRLWHNAWIALGTLLFSAGGSTIGAWMFYLKALGIVLLYLGVTQSLSIHRRKQAES